MKYFCDVHVQSKKDVETRLFIVLNENDCGEAEKPTLTKAILLSSPQYRNFCTKYRPKMVLADYTVHSTEAEVYANTPDNVFVELIENGKTTRIAQSEIQVDCVKDTAYGKGRKKKRISPLAKYGIIGGIIAVVIIAFAVGNVMGKSNAQNVTVENSIDAPNEDGMIIPAQAEISNDAEQITVSIDRSYAAVPTEDLQLKGEVVDGAAHITLPEFDKTDFFTHVSGHTWGFSTDPNGERIEYYGGATYSFTEDTKLYRVLVKYGGGSGTKDDPYLIDYYDQLALIGEEKARGYFKQTADIIFPEWATHTPIDTVNELKNNPDTEHFEYDGNGFSISNLTNPLFGKVSGAVIKNVNIQNSFIETTIYKNYGFIACEAYNYRYIAENGTTYETGETLIQHCTVSHSAIYAQYPETEEETPTEEVIAAENIVPPDLAEYDENGNLITNDPTDATNTIEPTIYGEYAIGAITGLGGQIESCYVTDFGIFATLDDYFLYAGGISGKPANVINSAVYYFSAQGNIFNAGGIAGNGGGSKLYDPMGNEIPDYYGGNIQGCLARNINLTTEVAVGGIVGEGSTNAESAIISNCYANELNFTVGIFDEDDVLIKSGVSGGIIGADGNDNNGHLIMNTVSLTNFSVIGSKTKSNYDDSVRLAPDYAFYQENILTVINKNSVNPNNPQEIYTGNFTFDNALFGDETGSLPYPSEIADLFSKIYVEEQ